MSPDESWGLLTLLVASVAAVMPLVWGLLTGLVAGLLAVVFYRAGYRDGMRRR